MNAPAEVRRKIAAANIEAPRNSPVIGALMNIEAAMRRYVYSPFGIVVWSSPRNLTDVNLCDTCENMRRFISGRGSVFLLWRVSLSDPNYPKYLRLLALSCAGHVRKRRVTRPVHLRS
jgi:hypothetical protein